MAQKQTKIIGLSVFSNGIKADFLISHNCDNSAGLVKVENRDKWDMTIKSFSHAARRRMREFLVSYSVPHSIRCGVTLTLPWIWTDDQSDFFLDQFADAVHILRNRLLRRFPLSGWVYRVELQQRGAPHLHIIAYHDHDELSILSDEYRVIWLSSIRRCMFGGRLKHFYRFGVKVDTDLSSHAAMRYISDHSTKHKQAQLGYKGKQWGVWGRDNFIRNLSFSASLNYQSTKSGDIAVPFDNRKTNALTPSQLRFVVRHIEKYNRIILSRSLRYPSGFPCVFGSHKSKRHMMSSVSFVSGKTVSRLLEFACRNVPRGTIV